MIAPLFDEDLRFLQAVEDFSVQQFVANFAIEALTISAFPWRTWFDVKCLCAYSGKPQQNGFAESFNGRFRDECLNEHLFRNLGHARSVIEAWCADYNVVRPHTSLDGMTPEAFAHHVTKAYINPQTL